MNEMYIYVMYLRVYEYSNDILYIYVNKQTHKIKNKSRNPFLSADRKQ